MSDASKEARGQGFQIRVAATARGPSTFCTLHPAVRSAVFCTLRPAVSVMLACMALLLAVPQPPTARSLLPAAKARDVVTSSGEPTFDRVIYINLARSVARQRAIEAELRKANLRGRAAQRWEANDGRRFSRSELDAFNKSVDSYDSIHAFDERSFRGTVGCRTSHTDVMAHLLSTGKAGERYLVLEDDVELPRDFEPIAHQIVSDAPADWDVLRLGCRLARADASYLEWVPGAKPPTLRGALHTHAQYQECLDRNGALPPSQRRECWHCGGAHAIVYRHERLARVMAGMGRNSELDCALSMPSAYSLRPYCVVTSLVRIRANASEDRTVGEGEGEGDAMRPPS